ncbi:MAG: PQQ-binding-like beta-propeller repeat protein [Candidatus Nealsonbacteria bacterium]|nr:PQQ-binding-like beta-propeller repeat protein [Candidatus Nealsonbacteria bacterium]
MLDRNHPCAALLLLILVVCCQAHSIGFGAEARNVEQADLARRILAETDVQGGLIIHLGCGDGKLTAALCAGDAYLVEGLETDAAKIEAARRYIRSSGLHGKVSVIQWSGKRLPNIGNSVNLVVIEAPGATSMNEVVRVLAPGGTAYARENGRWKKTVKPWPEEIDQWTHHLYDSTGINTGNDRGIGPPRHLQWEAGPLFSRSHENMSSVSAVVSSGGRVFSIMDEGPLASIYLPGKWYLTARDAFNGVLLWKKPIESWHARLFPLKSGPVQLLRRLVADDDCVYVTLALDAPVSKLDAATGKVLSTYSDTQHAEEILQVDGKLIVVSSNNDNTVAFQGRMPAYRPDIGLEERVLAVRSEKTITVIDVDRDKTLWHADCDDLVPLTVVADEKRLCFLAAAEAKCLPLNTGATIWERKLADRNPRTTTFHSPTVILHEDILYVALNGALKALDAASGGELWTARCAKGGFQSPASIFILNNLIWDVDTASEPYRPGRKRIPGKANRTFVGYDLRTGKIRKELPIYGEQGYGVMHHRCHMPRASGDYILTGFPGIELIDTNSGDVKHHSWIRGACVYGFMPANGLIYAPPHPCACYMQAKLSGFLAVAPTRNNPDPEPTGKETKLLRGPAFGKTGDGHSRNSESWPTYRGDAARSGRYAGELPTTLKPAWKTQLVGKLTQPVISRRRLFTVSTDHHELHAMDANSGELLWSYNLGGKVDSAPTCHKGMVIFGCRDGYVYNLRASDGEVVWRFRAAPRDSRLVSYNQVESVWPVHGSTLVQRDVLWFVAGRSSFLDGGLFVYRLDPETGTQLSVTKVFMIGEDGSQPPILADAIPPTDIGGRMATRLDMEGAKPDVLSCDGQRVFMRHYTFDLQGKSTEQNIDHLFSATGFLDDSWFRRTYWLYGSHYVAGAQGWAWAGNSRPSGRIMSIGVDSIFGFGRDKYPPSPGNAHQMYAAGEREFLFRAKKYGIADETAGKQTSGRRSKNEERTRSLTYQWSIAADLQVRAMLLAHNDKMLLVAGARGDWITSQDAYEGKLGSTLRIISANEGKTTSDYALSSPPVFDGISAANSKVYMAMQDGSIQCWSER